MREAHYSCCDSCLAVIHVIVSHCSHLQVVTAKMVSQHQKCEWNGHERIKCLYILHFSPECCLAMMDGLKSC